jgi:hypothetical protein
LHNKDKLKGQRLEQRLDGLAKGDTGRMLNKMIEILNEALGRKTATKGKVTYLHPNGYTTAPLLTNPDQVKQEADNHSTRAHGPKDGVPRATKQIRHAI